MDTERLQRNPAIFVLMVLGAIASVASALSFLPNSTFAADLALVLSKPLVALSFSVLFVTSLVTAFGLVWAMHTKKKPHPRVTSESKIDGCRLFQYAGYYPIDLATGSNKPSLNSQVFAKAIRFFLRKKYDRLAAMDLVYLREDNRCHGVDVLLPKYLELYRQLIDKYDLYDFQKYPSRETEALLGNARQIVHDLGDTLKGVSFEILLHDVRNPLRSIIAVKNSDEVSNRRLNDPSTRFVVQYVKHQGKHLLGAFDAGSKVAYPKQFTSTKKVKATTTPLYDSRYGLIGILCFNIDVDAILGLKTKSQKERFFRQYVATYGETPEFEKEDAPVA